MSFFILFTVNQCPRVLVKKTKYSTSILKLVKSKFKKCTKKKSLKNVKDDVFNADISIFISLTSAPETLVNKTIFYTEKGDTIEEKPNKKFRQI